LSVESRVPLAVDACPRPRSQRLSYADVLSGSKFETRELFLDLGKPSASAVESSIDVKILIDDSR
jgi:hypothetical protein